MIDHEDMTDPNVARSKVDCCILKTVTEINQRLACHTATAFGSADINRAGGYVITEPGVYCLKEDVVFSPDVSRFAPPDQRAVQAAITISSSNVVLDLGDHRLSQAGAGTTTQVPYVIGILVPDALPDSTDINAIGYQSIYIKGGDPAIIDGFSMYGIRIFAHTFDIRLANLTVKNIGLLAQRNLPRPTVYGFEYIPHTNQFTPGLGSSFGVGGIVIGEGSGFGMGSRFFVDVPLNVVNNRTQEVLINNVSCLNNYMVGINITNINNIVINDSHFDYTFSDDPGRVASPGLPAYTARSATGALTWSGDNNVIGQSNNVDDPYINGLVVNNSTFNYTQAKGDFTTPMVGAFFPAAGAALPLVSNHYWNNCEFCKTSNTFAPPSGFTVGFLAARGRDGLFQNCHFDDVVSLGTINGFHISGTTSGLLPIKSSYNMKWLNCSANNLQNIGNQQLPAPTLSTATVVGFVTSYAKNYVFENCESQDLSITSPSANASGLSVVGFSLAATAGRPIDPDDATMQNNVLRNCVASRCFAYNGGSVAGFRFQTPIGTSLDALKSVTVQNCISTGNVTFAPTLTTPGIVQGSAFGFYVLQENQLGPERLVSYPILFDSCKAMHNKGLPSSLTNNATVGTIYSSGFYLWNAIRHSIVNCDAIDNIYGITLNTCDRCTVRDCRADNNVDLVVAPGTGNGYLSMALAGTPAAPGVTNSTFENNRAFANGSGLAHDGLNANYNIVYNAAPVVWEPLLEVDLNAGTAAPRAINGFTTYFANLHNISTIN